MIGSTFQEVDSEFITCISIANISTDPRQAARIAEVVMPAPGAAEHVSETISKLAAHKSPTKEMYSVIEDQEGWDLMADRLQEKLDVIYRNWC